MTDRVAYLNGDSGETTIADVSTAAATYSSRRVVYVDPWCYIYDDTTGAEQLVPPAAFAASVAAQISPSTSIAWKASEIKAMLGGIVRLETPRRNACSTNTAGGVATIVKEQTGGYAFEAGVITAFASNPTYKNLTRTRIGDYIATSFVTSIREMVDAPNVEVNQISIVNALTKFMDNLVRAQYTDPNHTPHVREYAILDLSAMNSQDEIDSGQFTIPLNVKTSSGMEKIFLSIQFDETVTVTAS
jgi:phage tail sheath protein FI